MNNYVTGETIKTLRVSLGLTQAQLAEKITVSPKTVSKWETGKGLPDVTLLLPLAQAFKVSVSELISGSLAENKNKSANMRKSKFYVCPVCANVITATGEAAISCCGVALPALEAEKSEDEDFASVQKDGAELYVSLKHEMTKSHYVSFVSYVTTDRVQTVKLYPEGTASARFAHCGHGDIYAFCNKEGLLLICRV